MSSVVLGDWEAVAYIITGVDVAITITSLLQVSRIFTKPTRAMKFCVWAIISQILSTVVTFFGGYLIPDAGSVLTTVDGFLYPQMVLATFFAYAERVVTLEKLPHLNKYAMMLPFAIMIELIPDDISYIIQAWEDNMSEEQQSIISVYSNTMLYIDQIIYVCFNFTLYYMILLKCSKYLTVRKIRILAKIIAVVFLLVTIDIVLAVCSQLSLDAYNCGFNLSFAIKMAFILHFYDEKTWMNDILNRNNYSYSILGNKR